MKYEWKDLSKPLNCFTVRNATMINLNTDKIVRYYSANTKIVVVQKCVTPEGTYYRTYEACHNCLNFAFKASAFGLPNEKAPSAPLSESCSLKNTKTQIKPVTRTPSPAEKQKVIQKVVTPKDGGEEHHVGWLRRIFRRKNG